MSERKIGFRARGAHVTPMVCIQVNVPTDLDKAVEKRASFECFSKATFYRKWILEGFRRAQDKGEI